MNDHSNSRRGGQPQWPGGEDPDAAAPAGGRRGGKADDRAVGEGTGHWSPDWDDEDDEPAKGPGKAPSPPPPGGGLAERLNRPAQQSPNPQWPSAGSDEEQGGTRHMDAQRPMNGPGPRGGSPRPPARPQGPPTPPGGRPSGPVPGGAGPGGRAPMGPPPGGPGRTPPPPPGAPVPVGGPDGPTDMITPLPGGVAPEPKLLTHREPELEVGFGHEDYDEEPEEGEAPLESEEELRRKRKKKIWRRIRRTTYGLLLLMIIGPVVAFFIAYQLVEVPDPQEAVNKLNKTVSVVYADGKTEMARISPGNEKRTLITWEQLKGTHALNAVFAAEDATFMENSGFDIMGILGAVFNNVTGRGSGGGSTITQQYVKQATGEDERSLTRKALEIVKAYKMNNTKTKEEIITAYLNTIYFGRGAYGIQAAAQAYYGKDVGQLTPSEAALLAGMIQTPSQFRNENYQHKRWTYVLDKLVENKWLSATDRAAAQFPTLVPEKSAPQLTHATSQVWQLVKKELEERGPSWDSVLKNGYVIQLTIDKDAQAMAEKAVGDVMKGEPGDLRTALVAIDPKTGGVIAYNGYNQAKPDIDYAQTWQNPGSSFKPFDLVALLEQGKGLGETYDGTSGRKFGGVTINNSEGTNSCGPQCTVAEAMRLSINTVFVDIALNTVTTKKVAQAAVQAGIPANVGSDKRPLDGGPSGAPDINISIGGGLTEARPVDMANAYATFAANGIKHDWHFVAKVIDPNNPDNPIVYEEPKNGEPAFDKNDPNRNSQIAGNVTKSLIPVVDTTKNGAYKCQDGHPCAGKTGTQQYTKADGTKTNDNSKAWMVGYTRQISTAVWVGADGNQPIRNAKGDHIFGSGLPAQIWKKFMDAYLEGKPVEKWPKVDDIGKSPEDAEAEIAASRSREAASRSSSSAANSSSQPPSSNTQPSGSGTQPPESSSGGRGPSRSRSAPGWPSATDPFSQGFQGG